MDTAEQAFCKRNLDAAHSTLAGLPHPFKSGNTRLEYVQWLIANCEWHSAADAIRVAIVQPASK